MSWGRKLGWRGDSIGARGIKSVEEGQLGYNEEGSAVGRADKMHGA